MSYFYFWVGLILYGVAGVVVPNEWWAIIAVAVAGLGGFLVSLSYGVALIRCHQGK